MLEDPRDTVRKVYAQLAQAALPGGCAPAWCGGSAPAIAIDSTRLGYSSEELATIRQEAQMGLGCGNPQAIAALKPGETVLDLGSGGGIDCFLAAHMPEPKQRAQAPCGGAGLIRLRSARQKVAAWTQLGIRSRRRCNHGGNPQSPAGRGLSP